MNLLFCFWVFSFFYTSQETDEDPSRWFRQNNKCECGLANTFASRVAGGKETLPNEFPWMAALFYKRSLLCGGSLINDRYILTAGHCLKWVKKENLSVVLGVHDKLLYETTGQGGTPVPIAEIIVHEKFTNLKKFDIEDIALIKLREPVFFNQAMAPVCLPRYTDETYTARVAQVTGWGLVGTNALNSRYLKEANLVVLSNAECRGSPLVGKYITDTMICAYKEKTDACRSDSGGPLTYRRKTGHIEQIGVVSWGIGCAKPGVPGIYTRVTKYLSWIATKTQDATYCSSSV